jgi:hypothetical protein
VGQGAQIPNGERDMAVSVEEAKTVISKDGIRATVQGTVNAIGHDSCGDKPFGLGAKFWSRITMRVRQKGLSNAELIRRITDNVYDNVMDQLDSLYDHP